jgi:ubiquinone/menaquinone biosynthesis C-methylase UbiE
VCADANFGLPFESEAFSTVFMVDGFHYIQSKRLLANELERVTVPDGLMLLSHVHNAEVEVPERGNPLPFWSYADMFKLVNVRVFAEKSIIEDFLFKDTLSLQNQTQDIASSMPCV